MAEVPSDGLYLLIVHTKNLDGADYTASIDIEIKSDYGYLSAGGKCLVPVIVL